MATGLCFMTNLFPTIIEFRYSKMIFILVLLVRVQDTCFCVALIELKKHSKMKAVKNNFCYYRGILFNQFNYRYHNQVTGNRSVYTFNIIAAQRSCSAHIRHG